MLERVINIIAISATDINRPNATVNVASWLIAYITMNKKMNSLMIASNEKKFNHDLFNYLPHT